MPANHPPSTDTLRALESAPSMFLVLSPELVILTASDLYLEATRSSREAITGKHIFEAFPDNPDLPDADGVKNINASLQEVLRTKKRHVMNFQRYDVPDHSAPGKFIARYWDPSHTPVLDEQGEISYIVQFATNVTDQVLMRQRLVDSMDAQAESELELTSLNSKQDLAERELLSLNINLERQVGQRTAELKDSQENLQAAFDAAELGSCSLNLKTGVAEMSPRYRSLYGLPMEGEISWEMVTAAVEPEFLPEVNRAMQDALAEGKPVDSTYSIRHLVTGEKRWMRVVGKVRKDRDNSNAFVYAVVMDVTLSKQEEMRKNDFIAMASHVLKTPLTSISGYSQVLVKRFMASDDGLSRSILEKMERQLKKMSVMINNFLNITRLESGKIDLRMESFDLGELLAELQDDISISSNLHQIDFLINCPLHVYADRDKIGHVILHVISNAVKYSPVGSIIEAKCELDGNQGIFSVRDQGIGMDPEELPRIFDKYYRVPAANGDMVSGFGIGLFLSAEIINRHGGKIWAESEPGKGSTFHFSLPLV